MSTKKHNRPPWWILVRDVGSFLLGWALIFQQALFVDPARVNLAFLVLAGTLVGTPATSEAIARIRGVGIPTLPLPALSPPSLSSSDSSSSEGEPK